MKLSFNQILIYQKRKQKYLYLYILRTLLYAINIHRENAFLSGFNMNERYLEGGHKPEFVFSAYR